MNLLEQLAHQLMLGSERQKPQLPQTLGASAELATALLAEDNNLGSLRAAGLLTLCQRAGRQFDENRTEASQYQARNFTEPDQRPLADAPWLVAGLLHAQEQGQLLLVRQILQQLAAANWRLPAALLPRLLDLATAAKKPGSRLVETIQKVAGARGLWLARQNPDWQFLLVSTEAQQQGFSNELWEHANPELRASLLTELRQRDPAQGRQQLEAEIHSLDARERASLAACLEVGLSLADEPFLEKLLGDRSKEVRLQASNLLASLPQSQLSQRAQARLAPCLQQERRLLRKVWQLEAPAEFRSEWAKDGLDQKRPQSETLGERGYWLGQMVAQVPLDWWQTQLDLSPRELMLWAKDSDWQLALARAWYPLILKSARGDWAEALLGQLPIKDFQPDPLALINLLPQAQRELGWLELFKSKAAEHRRGELLAQLNNHLQEPSGQPPSSGFVRQLLQLLAAYLRQDNSAWDYSLRKSLVDLAVCLPLGELAQLTRSLSPDSTDLARHSESLVRIHQIADLRLQLHTLLASKPL